MKKYEINKETFAVVGKEDEKTRIIEKNEEYLIDSGAYQIMDESCCYYGSSYYGRLKAAKKMLNCSYKIPILVEESSCLIFFPIKSSLLKDCCWINLNSIKKSSISFILTLDFLFASFIFLFISIYLLFL